MVVCNKFLPVALKSIEVHGEFDLTLMTSGALIVGFLLVVDKRRSALPLNEVKLKSMKDIFMF